MQRIDLYLTKGNLFSEQIDFCCRLVEKAISQHSRIHIKTSDDVQNEALEDSLWTFKADSFLPHTGDHTQDLKHLNRSPIIIGSNHINTNALPDDALLVLLDKVLPDNIDAFLRLCLIIPNIESEIQSARVLYRTLQSKDYQVHIHDLRKRT